MDVKTETIARLDTTEVEKALFEMLIQAGNHREALEFAKRQGLGEESRTRATGLVYEGLIASKKFEEAADWAVVKNLGVERMIAASAKAVEQYFTNGNFEYGRTVAKERSLGDAKVKEVAKQVCLERLKYGNIAKADKIAADFGFTGEMELLAREAVGYCLGKDYSYDDAADLALHYLPREEVKEVVREVIKRRIHFCPDKDKIPKLARKAGILKEVKGIAQQYYDDHFPEEAVFLAEAAKEYLTVEEMRRAGKMVLQKLLCKPDSEPDDINSTIDEYNLRKNEEIRPAALAAYVFFEERRNFEAMAKIAKTYRLGTAKLNNAVKPLVEELLRGKFSPLKSAYRAATKFGGKEGIAIVLTAIKEAFDGFIAREEYGKALGMAEAFPKVLPGRAKDVAEKYFDLCMKDKRFSEATNVAEKHLGPDQLKQAAEVYAIQKLLKPADSYDIRNKICGFREVVREYDLDPAWLELAHEVEALVLR